MLYSYATLAQLKTLITNEISDTAAFYTPERIVQVMTFARLASERVRSITQYDFVPHDYVWSVYGKQLWHYYSRSYNALKLPQPLATVSGVIIGDDSYSAGDFALFSEVPNEPAEYLGWVADDGSWRVGMNNTITVNGTWCYRRDYASAWVESGDTITNAGGITAFEKVIEVVDVNGQDDNGLSPRFSIGQVIRVGDERMIITAINDVDDELTVKRGALGTTASAHAASVGLDTFSVEPDIVRATALMVSFNLANIDNHTSATISDLGVVQTIFIPDEAMTILNLYSKKTVIGGW